MKKTIVLVCLFFAFVLLSEAQEKRFAMYGVAFYNLENLFDTIHDSGKNDYEYLPTGKTKWTSEKYKAKLKNMSEVLGKLAKDKLPTGPAVIGVAEIENRGVLEDLVKQPDIAQQNYQIVQYEGPDRRGIDVGLLYNPELYEVTNSKLAPYIHPTDTGFKTRGFLVVSGKLAGEKVHFIVNHWPSRGAGAAFRVLAGEQVRVLKDSLLNEDPASKVIIMGDMNDDPMDDSMSKALGAKRKKKDVETGGLYNPWWDLLVSKGIGTLTYQGKWNLFDQIVLSSGFLGDDKSTLELYKNEVFVRDFMLQQEGKYKGSPKRTHGGGVWLNGYSDHLPTIVYLIKEVK